MPAIGLAYEMIPTGDNGSVVAIGIAKQIDTSSYAVGQTIYVGATAGSLTVVAPTGEGNLIQNIGKVTDVSVNGRVLVLGPGRTNATPNLNNGNIFLGNVSNQAVAITLDTSVVPELTNLYYTDTRARSAISVTDLGGDGSLTYNSSTGVITYTGPSAAEVRAHLSVAAGSGLTYNNTTGEFGTSNIPNSQLQNSAITVGTTAIALGSSATTIAGLLSLTSDSISVGVAGTANNIILNSSGITFEGSTADAFETTITVVDPTADQTITFPNNSGTVALSTVADFIDSGFRVSDNGDNTKKLAFECAGITTSTTRTLAVPDENGTIATQEFATAVAIALG
jgi:hypothetical protein